MGNVGQIIIDVIPELNKLLEDGPELAQQQEGRVVVLAVLLQEGGGELGAVVAPADSLGVQEVGVLVVVGGEALEQGVDELERVGPSEKLSEKGCPVDKKHSRCDYLPLKKCLAVVSL